MREITPGKVRGFCFFFWMIAFCVLVFVVPRIETSFAEEPEQESKKGDEEKDKKAEDLKKTFKAPDETEDTVQTEVEIEKLTDAQLASLEDRLSEIKEKVFQSKAGLKQLLDQLRMGSVSLISFSILHTQEVGATFRLEALKYTLDGFVIYDGVTDDEKNLDKLRKTSVYRGRLLPGEHQLIVDLVFRGKGYGVFSYLDHYLFKVKSRYFFTVQEGDLRSLHVISYDEGSFLTNLKDRLKVRFEVE